LERDEWTMSAFARDVAAVAESLNLRRAVLLGHSMGGSVVVEAARLMPHRIGGVIGVDTFQDVSRRPTDEEIEGFLAPLREDFPGATRRVVRGMFVPESDSLLRERIASDMAGAPPEIGVSAVHHFFRFDLAGAMRGVDAPVGAVNSTKYPTDVEALREAAPGFKLEIMDGVGHFLMREEPEEFNRTLNALLLDLVHS
jgi:pimeloyl-ACP methyl ester carboxylesterase